MIKPIAILSVNHEQDYLFLLPIVAKSWQIQGFDVLVNMESFSNQSVINVMPENVTVIESYVEIPSINKALYAQCIRLYIPLAANYGYCILGDADMFIASDFLYRDFDKVNVFGHDLTGFDQIPVCYVGAPSHLWKQIMGNDGMLVDLEKYSEYKSKVPHEAWRSDQSILTAKIKGYLGKVNHVCRGIDPKNQNLPLGRMDRYNSFKKPTGQIHDVHLMRDPLNHIDKLIEICKTCYPNEDWNWIKQYAGEFRNSISVIR